MISEKRFNLMAKLGRLASHYMSDLLPSTPKRELVKRIQNALLHHVPVNPGLVWVTDRGLLCIGGEYEDRRDRSKLIIGLDLGYVPKGIRGRAVLGKSQDVPHLDVQYLKVTHKEMGAVVDNKCWCEIDSHLVL